MAAEADAQEPLGSTARTLVEGMDAMSDHDLQHVLAAAVRAFAERDAERHLDAFPAADAVTATEVMVTTTAMLRTVELQLFELSMWQAWSGHY